MSPARLSRPRFAGFWPLCESVKNFFACGGRQGVRSQCGCHSAACRRLSAWCGWPFAGTASASAACRVSASSSSSAALVHVSSCVGRRQWVRSISAPRELALEAGAPHSTAVRAALFAYGRRLLHPQLLFRRNGHVFGRSRRACVALRGVRFSRISPFRRLKMRKIFWPRRGARSQGSELALQTRKNRPPAELGEPAERLASCSRSKKSAI